MNQDGKLVAKAQLSWGDVTGLANRTYIPENSERLQAKFGDRRDVADPIRDEIERAYAQGYWDALQASEQRAATFLNDLETLTAESETCKATLQFYANESHYDKDGAPGKAVFSNVPGEPTEYDFEPDLGHMARVALEPRRDAQVEDDLGGKQL